MNPPNAPEKAHQVLRLIEEITESQAMTLHGMESLGEVKGWDSLAAIGLISAVHKRFGTVIAPARLAQARSVDDLVRLVLGD